MAWCLVKAQGQLYLLPTLLTKVGKFRKFLTMAIAYVLMFLSSPEE
jgi:hypothetical protein